MSANQQPSDSQTKQQPRQLLLGFAPASNQPPVSRHLDDDLERDPQYDHTHAHAHGASFLQQRMRSLSTSNIAMLTQPPVPSSSVNAPAILDDAERNRRRRRGSHDAKHSQPLQFFIDVEDTQRRILAQEDTDGDNQITVSDRGPKVLSLGTAFSSGHNKYEIRGTYALANLLQELALANDFGRRRIVVDETRLNENPVDRLSRMIQHHFWDGLTRRIDAEGLEMICLDPKNRSANHQPRIYVPNDDDWAWAYYEQVAADRPHLNLDVVRLPAVITPQYVKSINQRPGILALALKTISDNMGNKRIRGVPFVVPGGRFNEMYGWDSYFEALGLLVDGRVELSRSMVDNFVYEIRHYGKILNANRSYYLTRSQPPFLTDMALKVYERLPSEKEADNKAWLANAFRAAIHECHNVWMSPPRCVADIGLSRFHGEGIGMPPETEASHFDAILAPFAAKYNVDVRTFGQMYHDNEVAEPELDEYFIHDRAVRESGHDTTYRLEGKCANICPVELNCLLYKYEIDIGTTIRDMFNDALVLADGTIETSAVWFERAQERRERINRYCWNEELGLFFDYDIQQKQQNLYDSATVFFALWAGVASKEQASRIVVEGLKKLEVKGGLVSGTEESRGEIHIHRPNRQWDYPYGWAPHQIVAWKGLWDYGYRDIAQRLAYRWLYTITFNGVVPEKFDVVTLNHRVNVEYGNVGIDFKYIPREGFGWMNSSYKVGLTYMTTQSRRALGALVDPDELFQRVRSRNPT